MTSRNDSTLGDEQPDRHDAEDDDTRLDNPEWIHVLKKLNENTRSQKHNANSRT